jgi:hypothetical protein
VAAGGFLVVIDREIDWPFRDGEIALNTYPKYKQWRRPRVVQPTSLTAGVDHVQLTEYASGVRAKNAPVTEHVGDQDGSVLIDFQHGDGRIVLLGEPYIVANNGMASADNLTLALNIVGQRPDGAIAFDEYHHGYGNVLASRSGLTGAMLNLYDYFRGTPVLWILWQIGFVAVALVYSRGRRFARPVPLPVSKRTRSLEYVASLAHLARRLEVRPFVLENTYRSFRRRVASTSGAARRSPAPSHAAAHHAEIQPLLAQCERQLKEGNISDAEMVALVKRIRTLEAELRRMKP